MRREDEQRGRVRFDRIDRNRRTALQLVGASLTRPSALATSREARRGQETQRLTRSARSDEPVDSTSARDEPRQSSVALTASQTRGQALARSCALQWRLATIAGVTCPHTS